MLHFEKNSDIPIYQQLYEQLRIQITDGILTKGQKLPPTRELSKEYHLSRNTVIQAYKQLEIEGYVHPVTGSGYYVEDISAFAGSGFTLHTETYLLREKKNPAILYDFSSYGDLDYNCYRSKAWHKCMLDAYENLAAKKTVTYNEPQGLWELRHALVKYLRLARDVRCSEDQIILTTGHQQSLTLISMLFSDGSWQFAMEDPGYNGTRVVMQQNGFSPVPIPLEADGISTDAIRNLSRTLLYITPSHQFPMGSVLPIRKRISLLQWAFQNDSYILEDDYDSELRYHSLPIPSLQSIDRNDRTIYMGTFSKSLSPDLRVAYLVLPKPLLNLYQKDSSYANCGVSSLLQYTLSLFLHSGEYQKHLNIMRTYYQKKHDYILNYFHDNLSDKATLLGANGGLHFILSLHSETFQENFIEKCALQKVRVYPVEQFWITPAYCPQNLFLLGFGSLPFAELSPALHILCDTIRSL